MTCCDYPVSAPQRLRDRLPGGAGGSAWRVPDDLVDVVGDFVGYIADAVADLVAGRRGDRRLLRGSRHGGGEFSVAVATASRDAGKWVANAAREAIKRNRPGARVRRHVGADDRRLRGDLAEPLELDRFGLDQINHPIAGVLSFAIKFLRSPLTTTVGLAIGLVGLATGASRTSPSRRA